MKNTRKIAGIITLSAMMFVGCDQILEDTFDSQLTVTPKTQYTPEQVFANEEGLETVVNGMYSQLQGYDYYGNRVQSLLWPHSGKYYSGQGANQDANSFNVTNTNINLAQLWEGMYQSINSANLIIKYVPEKPSLANHDTSLGQAYFIRGLVYYDLVRIFGEVPLRLIPSNKDEVALPKASREEIYNAIISDFKQAAQLLPDRGEYKDGRPLKYAANAYLARVYAGLKGENEATLNITGFDPVEETEITSASITNFWEAAADELDYVITNGGYSLVPTFKGLFAAGVENTSESIFELQYGAFGDNKSNDYIRQIFLKDHPLLPVGSNTFARIRPNKEMLSDHIIQYSGIDYTGQDFIPAGNNAAIVTLDPAVADPRISETYEFNTYPKTSGGTQNIFPRLNKGGQAYPGLLKYKDPNYNNNTTSANIILMRYAEVLLLRAEVENEINGPGAAYAFVNQVMLRARTTDSGVTTYPEDWDAVNTPDEATFRERILKEYEYELSGENLEWFLVRRRGLSRFVEQVRHHNEAVDFYGSENNKDFIFGDAIDPSAASIESEMYIPIPLSEIAGNPAVN